MDIKNLITFIQVAELSNFTKAAQTLGYSQSTISFQIKQLEQELDCQLFERINHTVALTERGRELLEYAHKITRLADEMIDDAKEEPEIHGNIRLAMADSLCSSLLDHSFLEFRNRYPGINLRIANAGTDELLRLMNHNEADAILTLDSHLYNVDYVIVGEEEIKTYFVASPSHPLATASHLDIRDLLDHPFILTEKGMSYRRLLDETLAASSLEVRPVLELGRTDLICNVVEQGIGISFLPEYVIRDRIEAGTLVTLPVEDIDIRVWKQLIHHRDKWVSPQLKEVLKYCLEREF
ncbi:MAG: LysR family transcriptional regulator [Firmicutes bacterium]|nr:LysR family transcriptional regulator [Bacillota bacterium]